VIVLGVDPSRFIGLAFAASDLLVEINGERLITFAAGAGRLVAGRTDAALVGQPLQVLFAESDQALGEALITGLDDGERRGPADVQLASSGSGPAICASLSVFRLPQIAPNISCALTLTGRQPEDARDGGLHAREDFETMAKQLIGAARVNGPSLELGLIEFGGLAAEMKRLSSEDGLALDRRLAGALRAEAYGDAATDLGDQRYAVLRRKGDAPDAVARRLARVLGASLEPKAHAVAIDAVASPNKMMRALRYALDHFLADGVPPEAATLSEVLGQSVQRTVAEAGAFGAMVEARGFKLVFQPVVSLVDGGVHHFEALVRFHGDQSPFAMIRMAEELDIIENLDCAVTDEAIKRIRADRSGALRLAVNVSGRTITSSRFMDAVAQMARGGDLADRLMFEITESAAIDDLSLAQRHIKVLQGMGFEICLDDFGAGAASFAYLRQLSVNVVKIDGSYVRELTSSGRNDAMIRHLVSLCRELGVSTVAEMVETSSVEGVLRQAGVDYAQGWLYGQPASEPVGPTKTVRNGRRAGAVEGWG
jgi:EAL domain-containing protein (putative c-di-GMP-specific phosphodiesterase class I)